MFCLSTTSQHFDARMVPSDTYRSHDDMHAPSTAAFVCLWQLWANPQGVSLPRVCMLGQAGQKHEPGQNQQASAHCSSCLSRGSEASGPCAEPCMHVQLSLLFPCYLRALQFRIGCNFSRLSLTIFLLPYLVTLPTNKVKGLCSYNSPFWCKID